MVIELSNKKRVKDQIRQRQKEQAKLQQMQQSARQAQLSSARTDQEHQFYLEGQEGEYQLYP